MKPSTRLIHFAENTDQYGANSTPIYQTSTFKQSGPGEHQGYDYSRGGNPTRSSLEESLAKLEGADYGLSFSSGLAAEQAVGEEIHGGGYQLSTGGRNAAEIGVDAAGAVRYHTAPHGPTIVRQPLAEDELHIPAALGPGRRCRPAPCQFATDSREVPRQAAGVHFFARLQQAQQQRLDLSGQILRHERRPGAGAAHASLDPLGLGGRGRTTCDDARAV